jgi:hypothetical protein
MANDKLTEIKSIRTEPEREQRIFTFKITQLVWLLFGILEGLIGLRVGLKLIGANPASPIAALIYAFTDLFLFPFRDLIPSPAAGGLVLELSSLFAMVLYALIAWIIERTIWVIFYRPRGPIVDVTQTKSSEHHLDQY